MRRQLTAFFAVWATCAGAETPEQALLDLLTEAPTAEHFAPAFLNQVPLSRVAPVLEQVRSALGPITSISPVEGDRYSIESATHRVFARITLDAGGQVIGLFFEPPEALSLSVSDALDGLEALSGDVAYLIKSDDAVLFDKGGDVPVPVASAFKLAVLAALIEQGRDLAEVAILEDRHISLPTGEMRQLPAPAPVTLFTAAAAMIAQSDNTATDLLMEVAGQGAIAAILGADSVLTTRAFFQLKADPALAAEYLADPASVLDRIENHQLPSVGAVSSITHQTGLGWVYPLTTMCDVIGKVADHPVVQINPGPVSAGDWEQVAYKGGSEPGVMAFVQHLVHPSGQTYCAAMSIAADAPLDEIAVATAWRSVLAALARETR